MIGEYINCPLTITKYGSSEFSYKASVDFGDGIVQPLTISNKNFSGQDTTFVALFSHRYVEPGFYSINFSIDALKVGWNVEENLQIFGMEIKIYL